jgi:uncharacterized protein YggT (Ycf19 family)
MSVVFVFVFLLTQVLAIAIIVRALLSWFPMSPNFFTLILDQVTEPVLAPLAIVPRRHVHITPIVRSCFCSSSAVLPGLCESRSPFVPSPT